MITAAHDPQRRRHGALARGQDRANQQQLCFPPGWAGEQRCEGNENRYNGAGQGEHGQTFLGKWGQASLPCLYSFSKLCVKPSQEAATSFLDLCRKTIGPAVSSADVREMLLQHILTKDIFLSIFKEDQFHQENNVARQLDTLERTFFTGDVRREAIERLRAYYGVIGRAADDIADYAEKQQFLKGVYEDFYTAYNPAAADRLGVVYTPNEVVDFIIRGADHLLQKHFGKTLADDNVQILDPATGTGTFVTNLINHLPADRLEHKYRHEIHANEVAILPYYIANLNIEYTYQQRTGRYLEFPNLCFVDTLDNLDWQQSGATGGAVHPPGRLQPRRPLRGELDPHPGAETKSLSASLSATRLITRTSRTRTTTTRTASTRR